MYSLLDLQCPAAGACALWCQFMMPSTWQEHLADMPGKKADTIKDVYQAYTISRTLCLVDSAGI